MSSFGARIYQAYRDMHETRPSLNAINSKHVMNRCKKKIIFQEVSRAFRLPEKEVKRKIHEARVEYVKEHPSQIRQKRPGCAMGDNDQSDRVSLLDETLSFDDKAEVQDSGVGELNASSDGTKCAEKLAYQSSDDVIEHPNQCAKSSPGDDESYMQYIARELKKIPNEDEKQAVMKKIQNLLEKKTC